MKKIYVNNIQYAGNLHSHDVTDPLEKLTCELEFGKVYGLQGSIGDGAWTLSWIIGGLLTPDQGTLLLDDKKINANYLRKISWIVRYDEIKRFGFISQSVKAQIQSGITELREENLINSFYLTPERYTRKLSQQSSEAWRSSCAIGFAHGKKIFCFPHMSYIRPKFITEYRSLWLEDMLNFLKVSGSLVLFPSEFNSTEIDMFDDVISVSN